MSPGGTEGQPELWLGSRRSVARSRPPTPKLRTSPYWGVYPEDIPSRTVELIEAHPLDVPTIVAVVHNAWDSLFQSSIGAGFKIGLHIFPEPQSMGLLLHELIPLEFEREMQGGWCASRSKAEKDLVCLANDAYSCEIKTSSSPNQIFANRSYGMQNDSTAKKVKDGYYIAVNFSKFPPIEERPSVQIAPPLNLIRFGWLDHTDWQSQGRETGQQANLSPVTENEQLLVLWSR